MTQDRKNDISPSIKVLPELKLITLLQRFIEEKEPVIDAKDPTANSAEKQALSNQVIQRCYVQTILPDDTKDLTDLVKTLEKKSSLTAREHIVSGIVYGQVIKDTAKAFNAFKQAADLQSPMGMN